MRAFAVLAVAAVVGAAQDDVTVRPSWRPGQELTYRLTRQDAVEKGSELARAHSGLDATVTRTFTLRVLGAQPGGGITARLHEPTGNRPPVTATFDADGAFAGASPAGALGADIVEAMQIAFLAGYKRPVKPGGHWAALIERELAAGRDLVDVDLELKRVAVEDGRRLAWIRARSSWAGRADPLPSQPEDPPELYVDGLEGAGEIVFDLDLGAVRHAEHSWRTSMARRASDGPGPAYEVAMGHVETTVVLDRVSRARGESRARNDVQPATSARRIFGLDARVTGDDIAIE